MDNTTLAIFVHEVRNQCRYTEAAFGVFNQALEQGAAIGVFFAAQSILMSASQIAAVMWPTRARAKRRGETLRQILQLPERHPLNDKRLSTLWEHSDEKLEDWIVATKGTQVVIDHLGPASDFGAAPVREEGIYRLYDPAEKIYYYRGDGFRLQAIADAVGEIFGRVNAVHRQMFPDQHQPPPTGEPMAAQAAPGQLEDAPAEQPDPAATQKSESATKKPDSPAKKAAAKKPAAKKSGTKSKPAGKGKKAAPKKPAKKAAKK